MTITAGRVQRLNNPIQHYAWGSRTAIADLTGRPHPTREPEAEMWMGAHPKSPSMVVDDHQSLALNQLVDRFPIQTLGDKVARRFDRQLPFLFKVLAAAAPLSIQAHPNRAQALRGYERENQAGIPLDAPHRNYRDANHKPEVICALTEFWGVNGFRPIDDLHRQLGQYCPDTFASIQASLRSLSPHEALRLLFDTMLNMPASEKEKAIAEAMGRAKNNRPTDPISTWLIKLQKAYPGDIGILAPVILNLVCLAPGQAMYLPAGQLHAYLDGVGIELMANSDNVLRGGLTPKHIDQAELMRVLLFEPRDPGVMTAEAVSTTEARYITPADEFCLSKVTIADGNSHESPEKRSIEMLLVTQGRATLITKTTGDALVLKKGDSALVPAAAGVYQLSGQAVIYKATVPEPGSRPK